MPSQKRASSENFDSAENSSQRHYQIHPKLSRREREEPEHARGEEEDESKAEADEVKDGREEDGADDNGDGDIDGRDVVAVETEKKDGSVGSLSGEDDKPEFIFVELANIRKDVQCPICLGIIKKTRTVMECLHRFCRECIDKSMRLGNNECPACRTHCASRRSLRDDPNYDALIAALYPDIDKYEQEELTFHEEEKIRNKQIQESIAQVIQRQEALVKRRPTGTFTVRSNRNNRTWRRRNGRTSEIQESDDNEDENGNGGKESSSADERVGEGQRSGRRRSGGRSMQPSSSLNFDTDEIEGNRECRGISPGFGWNTEILAWGKGGARSHTRHGNVGGTNSKNSRGTRLSKLIDYLQRMERDDGDLDIHLILVSIAEPSTPNLQEPYLCCRPSLSVRHLCEYVALHTTLQAKEVEIVLLENSHVNDVYPHPNNMVVEEKNGLRVLQCDETLAGVRDSCPTSRDPLVCAYRQKQSLANAS